MVALHFCIQSGYLECVQILLDSGVDVNLEGRDKKTPAMVAVLNDQPECLRKLIEKGANLTIKDCNKQTVLHFAVKLEKVECLEILISHPDWNVLDKALGRAVTYAAEHQKVNSLKILIEKGVEITKPDREYCFWRDPLLKATSNDNTECLTLLVQNGAFLHNRQLRNGVTAVTQASLKGYDKCLEILLRAGAPTEGLLNWQSPLHLAASGGHVKCLEMLLEKCPGDINKQDKLGCTPFWYAAYHGNHDCLELLVRAGADFKITNNKGETPIAMAAEHCHVCDRCLGRTICACYDLCGQQIHFSRCKTCWRKNKECECTQKCLTFIIELAREHFGANFPAFKQYISKCLLGVIRFDRGDALKNLLFQGADLSYLHSPLHFASSNQSIFCLEVLLIYYQTTSDISDGVPFDPDASPSDDVNVPALFPIVRDGWYQGALALIHAGANINFQNTTEPEYFNRTPLLECLTAYSGSQLIARVLFRHSASATLQENDTLDLHCSTYRVRLETARVLLAAGIPKAAIKSSLEHPRCDGFFANQAAEDKYKSDAQEFMSQLTGYNTLQERVRDTIGTHLMSLHPETNLFCLVPKLPLPAPIKEFLLRGETLNVPNSDSVMGDEMARLFPCTFCQGVAD